MEYQKVINLLDDTANQPFKFRTRNWVDKNDESKGRHDNSNIRFKASMIKSYLCDYSDSYILVKGTIIVPNTTAGDAAVNNSNKKVIIKNCAPFTDCITEINNPQKMMLKTINIEMPLYNLIEYIDAYSNTSGNLWQYYRDEQAVNANGEIIDFPANNNNSASFKFKQQITGQTGNGGTKDGETMVPLKYLSYFSRTREVPLINCEISLHVKWYKNYALVAGTVANQNTRF